jgi:hypothetical protein
MALKLNLNLGGIAGVAKKHYEKAAFWALVALFVFMGWRLVGRPPMEEFEPHGIDAEAAREEWREERVRDERFLMGAITLKPLSHYWVLAERSPFERVPPPRVGPGNGPGPKLVIPDLLYLGWVRIGREPNVRTFGKIEDTTGDKPRTYLVKIGDELTEEAHGALLGGRKVLDIQRDCMVFEMPNGAQKRLDLLPKDELHRIHEEISDERLRPGEAGPATRPGTGRRGTPSPGAPRPPGGVGPAYPTPSLPKM